MKAQFRGDTRRAKRLFEKAYSPDKDRSLAERFLTLVEEIEVEHTTAAGTTSGRVRTRGSDGDAGHAPGHGVLHDLRELVKHLDNTLEHDYLVLFDELDQDWSGESGQKLLLEQLIVAAEYLSRRPRISSCLSMRKDIYNTLHIDNADKMRESMIDVRWDAPALGNMIDRRIQICGSRGPRNGIDGVFASDCSKAKMWSVAHGNPRRAIQIVERCISRAQNLGATEVERSVHLEVLRECSDQFLRDHETIHRMRYPDLRKVALLLRGYAKSFDYTDLELFAVAVSESADKGEMPAWAAEAAAEPLRLVKLMLESGVLLAKLNRKEAARPYNDAIHPIDRNLWYEVHSSFAYALGIV